MGVSKSFGTNITENHLDNLSALFFGQSLDQMGQKCRYLAQNAIFGPNLAACREGLKKVLGFGEVSVLVLLISSHNGDDWKTSVKGRILSKTTTKKIHTKSGSVWFLF